MASGTLFPPWEPPPEFVSPPSDAGLVQRVEKLAEFVQRNGSQFQELMRQKQRDNPEYAFLFGGDGATFYRWILYCKLNNLSPESPPPGHVGAPQGLYCNLLLRLPEEILGGVVGEAVSCAGV